MSKVSVIIPVYKVEEYLEECVKSVVQQTYQDLEIILVDDGSPDDCPKLCDEWAKRDSRIIVIHKENGGVSSARNAALDVCTGKYIIFEDSDDYFYEDAIEQLVKTIEHTQADMVIGNYENLLGDEVYMGTKNKLLEDGIIDRKQYMERFYTFVPYYSQVICKLYRRELFQELRYPLGRTSEDAYIALLIVNRCNKIATLKKSFGIYRQREGSITANTYDKRIDDDAHWLEMHISFYQASGENDLEEKAIHQYCYMIVEYWPEITLEQKKEYGGIFKERCRYLLRSSNVGIKAKIKYFIGNISINLCVKLFRHGYSR